MISFFKRLTWRDPVPVPVAAKSDPDVQKPRPIEVGDSVVVRTNASKLPGGILHQGVVVEISEQRNFIKVRYDEVLNFEEWVSSYHVERREGASDAR